jgi:HSF-type DNA-binding
MSPSDKQQQQQQAAAAAAAVHDPDGDDDNMEDDSKTFPMKLVEILGDERYEEAICWLPHGRAFIIRNRKLFAETVMPLHFSRKAKYSSFTRKLNRWYVCYLTSLPVNAAVVLKHH